MIVTSSRESGECGLVLFKFKLRTLEMKKLVFTALAAAGLVAASSAFAAGAPMMTGNSNPWYVGVGVNHSADISAKLKDSDGDTLNLNDSGVGYNVFVGYQANHYFGTELGLTSQGDDTYKTKTTGGATVKKALRLKNRWNLHFVGTATLPVTDWFSPYVFGGVAYANSNSTSKATNTSTGVKDDYTGFGLIYGAGLAFNFNQFGVRVNYTRLDATSNGFDTSAVGTVTSTLPQNNDYISLDVLYRFGA